MYSSLSSLTEINNISAIFCDAVTNLGHEIIERDQNGYMVTIDYGADAPIDNPPPGFPTRINYFPDSNLLDIGFAPTSLIIYSDACANVEVYHVQYSIKQTDVLDHQWNVFSAAYVNLVRGRDGGKEDAHDELMNFFELAIGSCLQIEKVSKLNGLNQEEIMLRILRDLDILNSVFYHNDGIISQTDEDNMLSEYLNQTRYFYYKYLSRWCSLSKNYFESKNEKPCDEICDKVNWARIQAKIPQPLGY